MHWNGGWKQEWDRLSQIFWAQMNTIIRHKMLVKWKVKSLHRKNTDDRASAWIIWTAQRQSLIKNRKFCQECFLKHFSLLLNYVIKYFTGLFLVPPTHESHMSFWNNFVLKIDELSLLSIIEQLPRLIFCLVWLFRAPN